MDRTAEALRHNDTLFHQLMDNISEVFWLTDVRKNEIMYVSPGYEHVWGRTCESLYKSARQWMDAIHPEDRERVMAAAVSKQASGQYDEEYRILRPDGSIRWIRDRAFSVTDDGGEVYRVAGIAQDVTAMKMAQQEVSRLAAIVESSDAAIVGIDLNGLITSWNLGAQKMLGYSAGEIIGQSITMLMPPNQGNCVELLERIGHQESVEPKEAVRVCKNGSSIVVSIILSPVRDPLGVITGASAIARDITDQIRLEKEVLEAGEKERWRIGQDLHDTVCQQITAVSMLGRSLADRMKKQGIADAGELDRLLDLLREANRQARGVAQGLYPAELEVNGFEPALTALAATINRLFGIACHFNVDPPVYLPNRSAQIHLYRIAQEAATNAAKHAHCTNIAICLGGAADRVMLSVTDDGTGFDVSKKDRTGMGIASMHYRARMIGASLLISNRQPSGTIVVCSTADDADACTTHATQRQTENG